MAVLTVKQRKKLPKKDFALPKVRGAKDKFGKAGNKVGSGAFPIPDKAHALAALRLAPLSFDKGNITKAQLKTIQAKARAKLGKAWVAKDKANKKK